MIAEIEAGKPRDEFYDAKLKVLSEMIKHHVKEEEKRAEGMFAQARASGVDTETLGARMTAEKRILIAKYTAGGVPKPATPSFTGTKLA
jgi:hypothetical protein